MTAHDAVHAALITLPESASKAMTPVLRRILNLSKDDLYRSSVILFVGAVAGGGANYLFQIIMGRMLPVTTFGELNTLLADYHLYYQKNLRVKHHLHIFLKNQYFFVLQHDDIHHH